MRVGKNTDFLTVATKILAPTARSAASVGELLSSFVLNFAPLERGFLQEMLCRTLRMTGLVSLTLAPPSIVSAFLSGEKFLEVACCSQQIQRTTYPPGSTRRGS